MPKRTFCEDCTWKQNCKDTNCNCNAIKALYQICQQQNDDIKSELIKGYARELNVFDYEVSEELSQLGQKVINGMPELNYIKDLEIKVGYVLSYEAKIKDGKTIAADCRKVNGPFTAYLPFDFLVTFYEPNMSYMTDNQQKVLMLHELKHIGVGPRGLKIEHHNIEDFVSILSRYGLNWNDFGNDIEDILGGGVDAKEEKKSHKKESRKRQEMAT